MRLLLISVFSFLVADILSQLNETTNTTTTSSYSSINNDTSTSNITSVPPPVLIAKTKFTPFVNCKENPMLEFLPKGWRNKIINTLPDNPSDEQLKLCRNVETNTTCCTSDTISYLQDLMTNTIIPSKNNIYSNNIGLFRSIINEHNRNYIKGFSINNEEFQSTFQEFSQEMYKLSNISQQIVQNSLTIQWNSFCNYICNIQTLLDHCIFYNVSYNYNNSIYFDINVECKSDQSRIDTMKAQMKEYYNQMKNLSNKLDLFYTSIKTIAKELNERKMKMNTMTNETFYHLMKSIEDGMYVSKSTAVPLICDNSKDNVTLEIVANYTTNYNITCEDILERPCVPFFCLDNSFMQFYNSHEQSQKNVILETNYSKAMLFRATTPEYDFHEDIAQLLNESLSFSKVDFIHLRVVETIIYSLLFLLMS